MALVGHALLNTRKLPVYSTCRLCQQTQTLNLLVVVHGQCTMQQMRVGWRAGFQRLKTGTFG
jgi:enterochelin esterase-like enzyme